MSAPASASSSTAPPAESGPPCSTGPRIAGVRTFGTASTGKLDVVASYGAHPIDHTAGDVLDQVLDLTGDGVDVALDPIGGAHLAGSFRALREGGRLVSYGFSSVAAPGGVAST